MKQTILSEGKRVLIRTVTMAHIGEVVGVDEEWVVLRGGWLAETGRFSVALETGAIGEYEQAPDEFMVRKDTIVDVFLWRHDVPAKTK